MFDTIGAVVACATAGTKRTPVHRGSHMRGRCEGLFWRRTERAEVRKIVMAARRYELAARQPGARNGPLGTVAIEILELFANLVSFRTGQLDPSLNTIMAKIKRSRDAVARALRALREHGFLDWIRRYEPTGHEGRGPQVRQTSNAYRLMLPRFAKQLLGRWGTKPPVPDDYTQAVGERQAVIAEHRSSLTLAELPLFDMAEDSPLAQALSRLGKSIQQREYAKRTESQSNSFLKIEDGPIAPIPLT